MVKITSFKSKDGYEQFKVTIPGNIIKALNIDITKKYDWHNVNGFPALQERR